ncbi:MAG TPA: TetR family transcriptional regulator, partial [Oxalicibacterium sp.]
MCSARKSSVPRSLPTADFGSAPGSARHRADGAEARNRLLHAALHLFAEKGFSKTSTRDIAQKAGVNLAAIKYYFGDKAGLYRAVYTEPVSGLCQPQAPTMRADLPLREALTIFLGDFVAPLKQSELLQ